MDPNWDAFIGHSYPLKVHLCRDVKYNAKLTCLKMFLQHILMKNDLAIDLDKDYSM